MTKIAIYDTTLRDGTQSEELNLTPEDKFHIARKLDDLGIHYIEGGWPGSNPTDKQFFKDVATHEFKNSVITAFGSTHLPRGKAETDANLKALIESGVSCVTIFGKTWDMHVKEALRTTLERNIEIIRDSLGYLRPKVKELFYDAEHFFDGFKANADYAIQCLKTAHEAGAECLVLCDTNGGLMPQEMDAIFERLKAEIPDATWGIHTHNDSELAVANSLRGVELGATQVQGTINGYGERCGNANLCSIMPNLELKMGYECIGREKLTKLTQTANYVSEVGNLRPFMRQAFVGKTAFTHKGGVHVSAVMRKSETYEHIHPEEVGNSRHILLSDMAGRSNIMFKAKKYGYDNLDKDNPVIKELLVEIKERERMGYEYSAAEASFELLFFKTMGWSKRYFTFLNFFVVDAKRQTDTDPFSEATVQVKVQGEEEHTAATGNGPVNALDTALCKALTHFYPKLADVKLVDFKVRVLSGTTRDTGGTGSFVRVLIESSDGDSSWTTVGVSHNIIEASWQALVDSYNYKLFKDDPQKWPTKCDTKTKEPL